MKKIMITGCGFAGSGLAKLLLSEGHKVTVLDFIAPFQNWNIWKIKENENFKYNWKALQDVTPDDIHDNEIIIHLAAQADVPMGFISPRWTVEQNVMGTICLLEACKHSDIERIIYAGSGNEWGRMEEGRTFIDETHPLTPHNPYAFSKAAAELAMWSYYRCYSLPIVIMSNGIVTGPGMRQEIFIFKWLYNILRSKPIVLEGGDQTRDITYVSDVLEAWNLAVNAPIHKVEGEKFQVSYGEEHSVEEIMNKCFEICGKSVPFTRKPHRPGEKGQREAFDNSKARKVLGYNPKVGPWDAIKLTREWIMNEYEECR